jgi:hypothetical protein
MKKTSLFLIVIAVLAVLVLVGCPTTPAAKTYPATWFTSLSASIANDTVTVGAPYLTDVSNLAGMCSGAAVPGIGKVLPWAGVMIFIDLTADATNDYTVTFYDSSLAFTFDNFQPDVCVRGCMRTFDGGDASWDGRSFAGSGDDATIFENNQIVYHNKGGSLGAAFNYGTATPFVSQHQAADDGGDFSDAAFYKVVSAVTANVTVSGENVTFNLVNAGAGADQTVNLTANSRIIVVANTRPSGWGGGDAPAANSFASSLIDSYPRHTTTLMGSDATSDNAIINNITFSSFYTPE